MVRPAPWQATVALEVGASRISAVCHGIGRTPLRIYRNMQLLKRQFAQVTFH